MGKDSELLHAVKVEDVVTVQKIASKLKAKSSKLLGCLDICTDKFPYFVTPGGGGYSH